MLKRPCHYFNTTGKCRFGKHCKFLHDIDINPEQEAVNISKNEAVSQELEEKTEESNQTTKGSLRAKDYNKDEAVNTEKSVNTGKEKSVNAGKEKSAKYEKANLSICRSYAENRFCRYGNRCRYKHILSYVNVTSVKEAENVKQTQDEASTDGTQGKVQDEANRHKGETQSHLQAAPNAVKVRKVCKFFKQGYCKYGLRCIFYHPTGPWPEDLKKKNDNAVSIESSTGINIVEEATEEKQSPGDWRQVSRAPKIINVIKREDVNPEKQTELRKTEIQQLKRRFPTERLQIVSDSEEKASFIFTFFPSDPDWPFDVKSFDIQVEFGQDYPLKLFKVSLPLDQDLPATVRRYIEVSLQEWVVKKEEECVKKNVVELLFRPFLRWMDRNMETIVTEGLKQLRRELTAKAAGLEFISANELQKDSDHQALSEPDESSEIVHEKDSRRPVAYRKTDNVEEVYEVPSHRDAVENRRTSEGDVNEDDDDDEHSADSGEGKNDEDKVHQRPKIDLDTERSGTEMSFRNMQIWYCTTIMVEKIRLTVQCERCKNMTDFVTPPNRVNSVACSKCHSNQLVVFRPVLTHAYSSTFGYLDLDGCAAHDVILQDCHFSLGCVMCSRDILVKSFVPGRVMEVWCRGCHSKMKFSADSVKLSVLTSDGVDSVKFSGKVHLVNVKKNQRVLKDPAIQEGKPLPNNGTCKHYKKSYRWLRFPCCGKTYPCDICHEEKEDHEMKFANRMICGFCCKEQPYAAERPCSGCSSSLTKVRTTHWEGGYGCRDKITMSRSDEKKYSNLNKTVSNKAKVAQEKNKSKKNTKLRHT